MVTTGPRELTVIAATDLQQQAVLRTSVRALSSSLKECPVGIANRFIGRKKTPTT
jgi:hypothetical protein